MERADGTSPIQPYRGDRKRKGSRRTHPVIDTRSETFLRWIATVLSALGLLVAGYLSLKGIQGTTSTCTAGGCEKVLGSSYSDIRLFGTDVGIQWFGLLGYAAILIASMARGDIARLTAFGLSTFGFGTSLFLFGLQLFEIDAFCPFCITSGVLMTLLFLTNAVRLWRFFGIRDRSNRTDPDNLHSTMSDRKG